MKFKVVLILFLSFASQTDVALALWIMPQTSGVAVSQNVHSQSCCKSTNTISSCCTEGTQDAGKNEGNHNCGGPVCHCTSISMVFIVSPIGENKKDYLILSSKKNTWQFEEQHQKSVYFPIWSPPKLS